MKIPMTISAQKPENDDVLPPPESDSVDLPAYPKQRISHPITLKFLGISYKICTKKKTEKPILKSVTGMVRPGELLAMLGPSGSGKTTLLTALGGRHLSGSLSGTITYNGRPFSSSVKRRTGFVSQDDVLYPHLTVFETLLFTALLRLPQTLTKDEITALVDGVISDLGLTGCASTVVGGPFLRGVSGGERKRVSIGQEMLIDPSLLLLDEPTSGLDSTGAHRIMAVLRGLADGGRSVVTTVHQPSSGIYQMFDTVVVLAGGSPIYAGDGSRAVEYFSSIGFIAAGDANPADFLLDLANGLRSDDHPQEEAGSVRDTLISAYNMKISERLKIELYDSDDSLDEKPTQKNEKWRTTWWHQFKILLLRGLRERRFEAFNKLRVFQTLCVAVLGGFLWWRTPTSHIDDHISMLFFYSVFWGFFPLYNAVFTFPAERSMLIKERSSGMYRLSAYFLARTVGDLPMDIALPTVFTCIFYWMGGLKSDPVTFILSLLVVLFSVLVTQSLGLALGAWLMDVKKAATLSSVITVVFSMAGGYYVKQIPVFIVWVKYLSYSYYFYKLLLGVQYGENDYYECGKNVYCRVSDHPSIKPIGLRFLWVDVLVMAVMMIVYRVLAYLALHRVK